MFYTYILQSKNNPERHYIGYTDDLKRRLKEHNTGKCKYSSKYAPWTIKSYFAFQTKKIALNFELYLKSGSGRTFAKKHFE